MKEILLEFINNKIIITSLCGWAVAQVLKLFISCIVNKKFDITKLWSDGGMPSCHSSTVTALALMTAITEGVGSAEFAIAAVLAIIVMHDAMGVRLETGKQAVILNDLVAFINNTHKEKWSREENEKRLKEFVGHTPTQVFCGFLVGIIVVAVMYNIYGL